MTTVVVVVVAVLVPLIIGLTLWDERRLRRMEPPLRPRLVVDRRVSYKPKQHTNGERATVTQEERN